MVLNKRIPRVLRAHKAQYLGAVFLVLLSCLLFAMMNALAGNLQGNLDTFVQDHNVESAKAMTQRPVENLAALEQKYHVQMEERREFDAAWQDTTLRVFDHSEKINTPAVVDGMGLQGNDDVLLSPTFAQAHSLKLGDKLTLEGHDYTIRGFVSIPDYIYALKSEGDLMTDPNAFGLAVITKDEMKRLNKGHVFDTIKYEGTPSPQIKEDLQQAYGLLYWKELDQNPRYQLAVSKIQQTTDLAAKIPASVLLLTCLMLATTMWRMVKMEFSQIGTLYAMGYKKGEILRHYLLYPVILSLVGAVAGTGLALVCLPSLYDTMGLYFNIPMTEKSPGVANLVTALVIPLVFLVPTVALVVWRALRLKPVELMKGGRQKTKTGGFFRKLRFDRNSNSKKSNDDGESNSTASSDERNLLSTKSSLDRFSFPVKFRLRELTRNWPKSLLMLFGVLMSSVFLLFGFVTQSSVTALLEDGFGNTYKYQYDTVFNSLQTEKPSVGDVYNAAPFHVEDQHFALYGLQPDAKLISLPDADGHNFALSQTIITKALADTLHVQAGDTLHLVSEWNDKPYDLKLDAVADVYTGSSIYLPLDTLNEMLGVPQGSYIGIYSQEKPAVEASKLLKVTSRDELQKAFSTALEPMTYTLFVTAGVAFLIALIVLYVITTLIVEESRGSISMLKVLGYTPREINKLLLNTGTVPVVLGYLLAIPATLTSLDQLLKSATKGMDVTLPLRFNPWHLGIGFVILYGTYELSKYLAKKKVSTVSMAESLKMQRE